VSLYGAFAHEIGNKDDVDFILDGNLQDANSADFELAAQCRRRCRDETGWCLRPGACQYHLVVSYEFYGILEKYRLSERHAPQGEVGFSCA
jgi:hypothetical protein